MNGSETAKHYFRSHRSLCFFVRYLEFSTFLDPFLDYDRQVSTPDDKSTVEESVFSDGAPLLRHKKGISLSDFSSFVQSIRLSRTDISTKSSGIEEANGQNGGAVKVTKAIVLDREDTTSFYPRCFNTNAFRCKLPEDATELIEDEENAMVFHPGDNFLLMETAVISFMKNLLLFIYK